MAWLLSSGLEWFICACYWELSPQEVIINLSLETHSDIHALNKTKLSQPAFIFWAPCSGSGLSRALCTTETCAALFFLSAATRGRRGAHISAFYSSACRYFRHAPVKILPGLTKRGCGIMLSFLLHFHSVWWKLKWKCVFVSLFILVNHSASASHVARSMCWHSNTR